MSDETETRLLLGAYVDGELDAASALAFERRLAAEPSLAHEHEEILRLRSLLSEALPREAAPQRLHGALARIGTAGSPVEGAWRTWLERLNPKGWARDLAGGWRMGLAAGLLGAVIGAGLTTFVSLPQSASTLDEVVGDHLRAVMAPQPFDVASSDQHTVKPWFTGRLPFAPRVFDLAAEGFVLAGGRVDVVDGQPASALVFRHGKHLISLISQPAGQVVQGGTGKMADRGFEVRRWTTDGMRYWAVSDVAAGELDAFEAAARAELARSE